MKDVIGAMPGMGDMIPEGEDPEDGLAPHPGHDRLDDQGGAAQPRRHRPNRRRRIAAGSGAEPHEIKQFLGQFDQVRTLMRQMAKMSIWERIKMMTGMGKAGAFCPGAKMIRRRATPGTARARRNARKERKKKKR